MLVLVEWHEKWGSSSVTATTGGKSIQIGERMEWYKYIEPEKKKCGGGGRMDWHPPLGSLANLSEVVTKQEVHFLIPH